MKQGILKRIVCGVMAFACAILAMPSVSGFVGASAKAEESKGALDVYLIAGQSNAAGYSMKNMLTYPNEKKDEWSAGYDNVWYHGASDNNVVSGFDVNAKLGQGRSVSHFGAEVGMAEVISQKNPNGQSVIIKKAIGGTYLIDNQTADVSKNNGNWCPPSMRTESAQAGLTGKIYDDFVDIVEKATAHYRGEGYTVNLMGTFWMQGEAENGAATPTQYAEHLKALILDLRVDIADDFDNDVNEAPFVIGKIAPTFAGGGSGIEQIRMGQDMVAGGSDAYAVHKAYTIETTDYVIVDPNTNAPASGCYDRYHFSADDMISIGYDVANCIWKYNVDALEVVVRGGGSADVTYQVLNGEPITVTFTPEENHVLKSLTKNGVDVTSDMVGSSYTVSDSESVVLVATFAEAEKYALKLVYDKDAAKVVRNYTAANYFVGQELYVTVTAKDGFEVVKVSFNGEEVEIGENGKYLVVIAEGDNTFEVETKSTKTDDSQLPEEPQPPTDTDEPKEPVDSDKNAGSGCGSSVAFASVLFTFAVGMYLTKGKNRD